MANTSTFVEHALDLLALAGPVDARRMFGGHGLYFRGVMFGLLDDDELFLKTDDETRPRFVEAGCRCWAYPGAPGPTSYFRPPDGAHEDAESMMPWARLAIDAALRKHAAKVAEAAARAARRAAREAAAGSPPSRRPARSAAKPAKPTRTAKRRRGGRRADPGAAAPRRRPARRRGPRKAR